MKHISDISPVCYCVSVMADSVFSSRAPGTPGSYLLTSFSSHALEDLMFIDMRCSCAEGVVWSPQMAGGNRERVKDMTVILTTVHSRT